MKEQIIDIDQIIPNQAYDGVWIGRCMVPSRLAYKGVSGPHVVTVTNGRVYDLSAYFNSTSKLINTDNSVAMIKQLDALPLIGNLSDILKNSIYFNRDNSSPYLISPNDIQSVKACGVTFVKSLMERLIEEKAGGNAKSAEQIRKTIYETLGNDLSKIVPGSSETETLKKRFQEIGLWSQYLEVGIGKDAEVFTKSQPMSAVSFGAQIGVLKESTWNNSEPEIVLAVSSKGKIIGATLGNDVNLRDYEGRSALLLGEAKDQNGSCSIGPLFRLFDETFSIEDVKNCEVQLTVIGQDGFHSSGSNKMSEISRSPERLVTQTIGDNHQYPDGLVLFLGTMFAPTENRDSSKNGFTHIIGDEVIISSPKLGQLINWVNTCENIPQWEYGIHSFIDFCIKRVTC